MLRVLKQLMIMKIGKRKEEYLVKREELVQSNLVMKKTNINMG